MARTIPILGIVAALLAALAALSSGVGLALLFALFAIGSGTFLAISKDLLRIIPGACAILFAILGLLGVLNITTENASLNLGIGVGLGQAFLLVALLEISGASLLLAWQEMDPEWMRYLWAGVWGLAFILAMALNGSIGAAGNAGILVLSFLSLANVGPAILALRNG